MMYKTTVDGRVKHHFQIIDNNVVDLSKILGQPKYWGRAKAGNKW